MRKFRLNNAAGILIECGCCSAPTPYPVNFGPLPIKPLISGMRIRRGLVECSIIKIRGGSFYGNVVNWRRLNYEKGTMSFETFATDD